MARKISRRVKANLKAAARLGEVTKEEIARRKAEAKLEKVRLKAEAKAIERKAVEDAQAERARLAGIKSATVQVAKEALKERMNARHARDRAAHRETDPSAFILTVGNATREARAAAAEYVTRTTADREGNLKTETVLGRDGMPLRAHPAPVAEPEKPAPEPVKPVPGVNNPQDLQPWAREGRQPTVEELKARHRQRETNTQDYGRGDIWAYTRGGYGSDPSPLDGNGVRVPVESGRGNMWDGTLKGL